MKIKKRLFIIGIIICIFVPITCFAKEQVTVFDRYTAVVKGNKQNIYYDTVGDMNENGMFDVSDIILLIKTYFNS